MKPYLGKGIEVKVLNHNSDDVPKALLIIGYPLVNINPDFPSILTTVFGKLSMDGQIKLIDLHIPDSILSQFPGPRFGIIELHLKNAINNKRKKRKKTFYAVNLTGPITQLVEQAKYFSDAGGGIHGHPHGTSAGGKAYIDAIEAIVSGRTLEEAAEDSTELLWAIKKWGTL